MEEKNRGLRQQPFYRTAVPVDNRPTHKTNPEVAGLMLDPQGKLFDCMGRYTPHEIKSKFGGK